MGQNWDYKPRLVGGSIVLEVEPETKPNFIMLTGVASLDRRV